MCNMNLMSIERNFAQEEMAENDAALNNVNAVGEIGQTLAEIGDILNDEVLQKHQYYHLVTIGIVLTFAAILTLRST